MYVAGQEETADNDHLQFSAELRGGESCNTAGADQIACFLHCELHVLIRAEHHTNQKRGRVNAAVNNYRVTVFVATSNFNDGRRRFC